MTLPDSNPDKRMDDLLRVLLRIAFALERIANQKELGDGYRVKVRI